MKCPVCRTPFVLNDKGNPIIKLKPLKRFQIPGMPRPFPSLLIGVCLGMALMWLFENSVNIYLYVKYGTEWV